MLFKDFMTENSDELKAEMIWDNYGLNDVVLPVSDDLKEHALKLLTLNYGKYDVGETEDILDEMKADVFVNFPLLMQSLSIAASMTYESVSKMDIETEERIITETGTDKRNSIQSNNTVHDTAGKTDIVENTSVLGEIKNTGTVNIHETSEREETTTIDADTESITPATGSKSVALTHNMPEQAISGITNDFTHDEQGTPEMDAATVQNASANYSTINQFQNTQAIDQTTTIDNEIINDNTRTDDTTQITDNMSEAHSTNTISGQETTMGNTTVEGTNITENTITDTLTAERANKQYPYEISKFLESIDVVKPVVKWVDAFSWLIGVV